MNYSSQSACDLLLLSFYQSKYFTGYPKWSGHSTVHNTKISRKPTMQDMTMLLLQSSHICQRESNHYHAKSYNVPIPSETTPRSKGISRPQTQISNHTNSLSAKGYKWDILGRSLKQFESKNLTSSEDNVPIWWPSWPLLRFLFHLSVDQNIVTFRVLAYFSNRGTWRTLIPLEIPSKNTSMNQRTN